MTELTDQVSEASARLDSAFARTEIATENVRLALAEWREANEEFKDALKARHESRGVFNRSQRRARDLENPDVYDALDTQLLQGVAHGYITEAKALLGLKP